MAEDDGIGTLEEIDTAGPEQADDTETEDGGNTSWRNPNPGKCRVCLEPVKMPRQYCDNHQHLKAGKHPPRARKAAPEPGGVEPRSSRTRVRPTDRMAALEYDLTGQVETASLILQMGAPVTGVYLQRRSARIARDMTNIARRYPAIADYLSKSSDGLVFLGIAEDGLGLLAALRVDIAKADPYTTVNRLTGVTAAYQQAVAERGLPDSWAEYHAIRRMEAERARDEHVAAAAGAAAGYINVGTEDANVPTSNGTAAAHAGV